MSSQPDPVPDLSVEQREALSPLLDRVADLIPHDGCIVGLGRRDAAGQVVATQCFCNTVPREFIDNYAKIADIDSAAQLFVSNATSVLSISTLDDYPYDSTDAAKVGKYLRKRNVAQLLMAGIDSSMGVAWITLYKLDADVSQLAEFKSDDAAEVKAMRSARRPHFPVRFTSLECERASYILRAGLYDWQMKIGLNPNHELESGRYTLIPLEPRPLDVAIRVARGYSLKEIRNELGISRYTVDAHCKAMKRHGLTSRNVADRLMGKLPPPRVKLKRKLEASDVVCGA